ncbi:hypothetical protein ABT160_12265 [Streptomyces sp. NPDC001941]|uniref:preprotein translocase subunit SecY n=1 Tax=Streptomyces sp. NPDC001941 TaxID=3154659 RepID=UPI0033180910
MNDSSHLPRGLPRGLTKRLLLTLLCVVVFRLGQQLPLPGVDIRAVREYDLFPGPVDLLTGGALPRLAVLGLGVYPFLSAGAVMGLLVTVVPRLSSLAAAGPGGARRIRQYTRVLTVVTAAALSTIALLTAARLPGPSGDGLQVLRDQGALSMAAMVAAMTAGSIVAMRLAELISDHGTGNGFALLIGTQILAVLPGEFWAVREGKGVVAFVLLCLLVVAVVVVTAFVEGGRREVPVQFARRMIGRRTSGATSAVIPLRVGPERSVAGQAANVLFLLALLTSLAPDAGWLRGVREHLVAQTDVWRLTALALLIVLFTFFTRAVDFDVASLADRLKREGAFIPGIRPGYPTADYLRYVSTRITTVSALYLVVLAFAVTGMSAVLSGGARLPYGGEAVFFVVALAAETVAFVNSARLMERYAQYVR